MTLRRVDKSLSAHPLCMSQDGWCSIDAPWIIHWTRSHRHPGCSIYNIFLTWIIYGSWSTFMFFSFLSHLNNDIRKHASSHDTLSRAQRGKPTFQATLKKSSLCILIQKILCGFISTNPSLLYFCNSDIWERPYSCEHCSSGVYVDNGYTHTCALRFLCVQTGETSVERISTNQNYVKPLFKSPLLSKVFRISCGELKLENWIRFDSNSSFMML